MEHLLKLKKAYPALYPLWRACANNARIAAMEMPEASESLPHRREVIEFGLFLNDRTELSDEFLDIGSGSMPGYLCQISNLGYAIDPFEEIKMTRRGIEFEYGVAEFLPYKNAVIDIAIMATTLDHCISPPDAIKEAWRVLKPGGFLLIWTSERTADYKQEGFVYYPNGSVFYTPQGAVDPFHMYNINIRDIHHWAGEAGFRQITVLEKPEFGSVFLEFQK